MSDAAAAATEALAAQLNRRLPIGTREIENRLVLAPMTFLGHVAFRELVDEFGGCGLLWTEMCSCRSVPQENPKTSKVFRWRRGEVDRLVCQLFGSEPEKMAAAACRVEQERFFGVDINFGCSAGVICRNHCGAALLKTPSRAEKIVAAVRGAVRIPVFVKFRTGWTDAAEPAVDLARRFADAGADALVFHPRVAPDRRSRPARWEYIGRVKEAVPIPVFGNGDVFTPNDCLKMLGRTGCDGVALGRIAVARPWVFAQWTQNRCPEAAVHLKTALRLADLLEVRFTPEQALRRYQRFAMYFSANFRFGHTLFTRLRNARDMSHVRRILTSFFRDEPGVNDRPNLNFFN